MNIVNAQEKLKVARKHLDKVQVAWGSPTDWSDLYLYGFYCLEAAVMAAAIYFGIEVKPSHPSKVNASQRLHREYGLMDIEELLIDLNSARKAIAYGDISMPKLDPEDTARIIEEYVEQVAHHIGKEGNNNG